LGETLVMDGKSLIWATALLAISTAPTFSEGLSSRAKRSLLILARTPVFNLSKFDVGASVQVSASRGRANFPSVAQLGYDFQLGSFIVAVEPTLRNNTPYAGQIAMASALTIPAVGGKTRGVLDQAAPTAFGGLAPIATRSLPPSVADLASRLAKIAGDRGSRDALSGPGGASSSAVANNLEEMGVVVQGLNNPPEADERPDSDNSAAASAPIQSYPMSAAALAEQRGLAAKYGVAGAATNSGARILASADPGTAGPSASGFSRAFDASEGTPLDPLLNTTYDLNYPKVVPSLK
jgi:hypothetical protein